MPFTFATYSITLFYIGIRVFPFVLFRTFCTTQAFGQTVGVFVPSPLPDRAKGTEKDLLLDTIQMSCVDTGDRFRKLFPIGTWLDIMTITEINPHSKKASLRKAFSRLRSGCRNARSQLLRAISDSVEAGSQIGRT